MATLAVCLVFITDSKDSTRCSLDSRPRASQAYDIEKYFAILAVVAADGGERTVSRSPAVPAKFEGRPASETDRQLPPLSRKTR